MSVIASDRAEVVLYGWRRQEKIQAKQESPPRRTQPMAVLVADDNESYRSDLVEFLQKQKWIRVVGEAKNGDEALALTREMSPDLVLIDVNMPGMSGFEATRQIKNLLPRAKVVFTTIHEKQTYDVLSEYLNADGFVCKSSAKREIPRVLKRLGFDIPSRQPRGER